LICFVFHQVIINFVDEIGTINHHADDAADVQHGFRGLANICYYSARHP
jgi:hypothetical protein